MAPVKKPDAAPRDETIRTMSGIPLQATYRPSDLAARGWSYEEKLGDPGQ